VTELCQLDPALLDAAESPEGTTFAVIRYGRLCHVSDGAGGTGEAATAVHHTFSVTKTLGALMTGAVMYETRDLSETDQPMTGPLREFDRMDHWVDLEALPDSARINPDATIAHVLAMVGYSESLAHGDKQFFEDTRGNREINYLIDVIDNVVRQDPERLVDTEYVYNMTHPAFEDGSTTYGYLTWLNNLTCAPRAIHRSYPHGLSEARDCGEGDFSQEYDVGAWSALGAQASSLSAIGGWTW